MNNNSWSPLKKVKYGHRITLGFGVLFGFITILHTMKKNDFSSKLDINIEPKQVLETLNLDKDKLIHEYINENKTDYCFVTACDGSTITVTKNTDSTYSLDWVSASNRAAKDEDYFERKLSKYIQHKASQKTKSLLIINKSDLSSYTKKLSVKKAEMEGFNRAHNLTGNETPLTTIAKKLKSIGDKINETTTQLRFQESIQQGQTQQATALRQRISKLLNEKKATIKPLLQDSEIHIKVAKKDNILLEIRNLEALIVKIKSDIKLIEDKAVEVQVIHTI